MALYSISYDLVTPGQDYSRLIKQLEAAGAKKILLSQWVFKAYGTSAAAIRDSLVPYIDKNDRLFVADVTDKWAGWNLMLDPNKL